MIKKKLTKKISIHKHLNSNLQNLGFKYTPTHEHQQLLRTQLIYRYMYLTIYYYFILIINNIK